MQPLFIRDEVRFFDIGVQGCALRMLEFAMVDIEVAPLTVTVALVDRASVRRSSASNPQLFGTGH
jgi:hypothetical protein